MKKLIQGIHSFQTNYVVPTGRCSSYSPRVSIPESSSSPARTRIDPNLITQAEPGEMFIIRNAGNIIPYMVATNGGEGAAVEYAVHALGIKEVIVCGHSHCGAMRDW